MTLNQPRLVEKILNSAQIRLAGKTVTDLVVGISLVACELSSSEIGISYVLRDDLPNGCSAFPYAQEVIGKPAAEIASWLVTGSDNLKRAIGDAVLTASAGSNFPADDKDGLPFGIETGSSDTVGMIGLIEPIARMLEETAGKLIVFDEGLARHGGNPLIMPSSKQAELLPTCDIVVLSGTTVVNGSIDSLLQMCQKAREIIMVGTSTPMLPAGFKGSGITRLAGSCWDKTKKAEIFRLVSLACGISHLHKFNLKKVIPVNS